MTALEVYILAKNMVEATAAGGIQDIQFDENYNQLVFIMSDGNTVRVGLPNTGVTEKRAEEIVQEYITSKPEFKEDITPVVEKVIDDQISSIPNATIASLF